MNNPYPFPYPYLNFLNFLRTFTRPQTRTFSVLFQYLKTKKKNRESKDTATCKPLLPCCLFHLTIITAGQGHKDGKSSAISKLREVILFYDGVQVGGGIQLQMARQNYEFKTCCEELIYLSYVTDFLSGTNIRNVQAKCLQIFTL